MFNEGIGFDKSAMLSPGGKEFDSKFEALRVYNDALAKNVSVRVCVCVRCRSGLLTENPRLASKYTVSTDTFRFCKQLLEVDMPYSNKDARILVQPFQEFRIACVSTEPTLSLSGGSEWLRV